MARIKEEVKINFDIKKELETIVIKKENEIFRFTIEEIKNKIEEGWFIQSVEKLKVFTSQNKNILNFKKQKKHGIVVRIADFAIDDTFYKLFNEGFNTFEVEAKINKRYIYRSETEFDVLVDLYRVNQIHRCKIYDLKESECPIPFYWNWKKEKVENEDVKEFQEKQKYSKCANIEIEEKDITNNIVILRIKNSETFFCADREDLVKILDYDVKDPDKQPVIEQKISTDSFANIGYLLNSQMDRDLWIYKIPYIEVWVDKSLIDVLRKKCNTIVLSPLKTTLIYRSKTISGLHDLKITVFEAHEDKRNSVIPEKSNSKFNYNLDLKKNVNHKNFPKMLSANEIIKKVECRSLGGSVNDIISNLPIEEQLNEVYEYFLEEKRIDPINVPDYVFSETFCLKLVSKHFLNVELIPQKHLTKEVIKKIIELCPTNFIIEYFIPINLYDEELVALLINKNPRWILKVPEAFIQEKHRIQALNLNGKLFKYIKEKDRTEPVIMAALKSNPKLIFELEFSTPEMQKFAISNNGLILEELDEETMSQEIVYLAVENNAEAIRFVPEKFLNSKTIIKALNKDPKVISLIDQKFITENVVNFYVYETKNWSLEFVPIQFRTEKICQLAFDNNKKQIEFIPKNILSKISYSKI